MADYRDSGIYEIVNLINGKRYIGSSQELGKRFKLHRYLLACGKHHGRHLQASWNKCGPEFFTFRVIIFVAPEHLLFFEQIAIDAFRPAYNTSPTAGSRRGLRHSEETKAKLSAMRMGNKHTLGYRHTPETLAKMSQAKQGNTATKGKRRNQQAVEKTAAAHRGMKRSEKTRAAISAAMTGKKHGRRSAEWCLNISLASRGKPKSRASIEKMRLTKKGLRLSEAHRAAIGRASKAAWARRKINKRNQNNGQSIFVLDG